jgi:hypothetical protein
MTSKERYNVYNEMKNIKRKKTITQQAHNPASRDNFSSELSGKVMGMAIPFEKAKTKTVFYDNSQTGYLDRAHTVLLEKQKTSNE